MEEKYDRVNLEYTIYHYSSFSGNCVPENILAQEPLNQQSRWFTDSNQPNQYIMLKLKAPAIVEGITFGKYIKAHVSDLKKFHVLGGTDPKNLSLLLIAGLKNDSSTEEFTLRHRTSEGLYLPILYIKIVPLQSWGPAYNYTIWYVALHGKNNEDLVSSALETMDLRKEEEAVRILLKHLRRRKYTEAYEALSRESGVQLEGPCQTRLWNALVEKGDFEETEIIFDKAVKDGELDWYMSWRPHTLRWRQVSACSMHVEESLCNPSDVVQGPVLPQPDIACIDRDWINMPLGNAEYVEPESCILSCSCKPGPRGGHQLVIDSTTSTLYLFGGWNGTEDLDDLWSYDIQADRWMLLCAHSGMEGGPSPRSCHKMVFDPINRKLYTLGRYLDNVHRLPRNMNSDLYVFDVGMGEWSQISEDTSAVGGPRLVFDHQMCIDPDTQTIYVFGGRVLPANSEEGAQLLYSGLYAYYIKTNAWQLLLHDQHQGNAPLPRVGHSMVFHPVQRRLYIFAGQRNKELLLDLWWWDVQTGRCGSISSAEARPPPAAGFTQRATLDPDTDDLFVLSGMSKEKDKRVFNTLWVFSLRRRVWSCLYRNERASPADPRPRFAHQLVYDSVKKIHYLFGGNPGNQACPRLRLDDLWALQLSRPALAVVAGRARATLREARYRQLASGDDPARALHYLRNDLHNCLDHTDPLQVQHFQRLATLLFSGAGDPPRAVPPRPLTPQMTRYVARARAQTLLQGGAMDSSRILASVLGADDSIPESPQPYEEWSEPETDTWDIGDASAGNIRCNGDKAWNARSDRIRIFDELSGYFRPSTVPPSQDLLDLVTF